MERHSYEKLKSLVETVPDFIKLTGLHPKSLWPSTHLMMYVEHDDYDCAKLLLDNKADPNAGTYYAVPLSYAKSASMTRLLLEYGADPNKTISQDNNTPLFYANYEQAKLLIEYKADVHHVNNVGNTALSWDISPCIKKMRLLLEHGVDPNVCRIFSHPLGYVCHSVEHTKLLLDYKADANKVLMNDVFLYVCLDIDVFILLLDHMPDLYVTDKRGQTLLCRLVKVLDSLNEGSKEMRLTKKCIRILLERMQQV